MSEVPKNNRLLKESSISDASTWPDQIWFDRETGEEEVRPPQQESYIFGNPNWPIALYRDYVVDTVLNNPVTVLSSGTGNGKSIFMPQAIYESGKIDVTYITQTRIVAARENTEFIRYQMEQATGYDMSSTVGYTTATEGDHLTTQSIRQHTDGYMVQKLINPNPREKEAFRKSLLIIDEAHERNPNIDIAMALSHQTGMRLLIQSASIDAGRVAKYCSQARGGIEVPVINIPGVMHDVEHLEGGDLHSEIVKYAHMNEENPLNIMALIPGKREAQEAMQRVMGKVPKGYSVFTLNGDQTISEQRRSFQSCPGGKIVLATEVARQSITIPDLDVVLDGGYQRTGDYRLGVRSLRIKPASMAGIIQGSGRVGRTKPGKYVSVQLPGYPPIPKDGNGQPMIDSYDTPPIQRMDPSPYALRLARSARRLDEIGLQDEPRRDEIEHAHHKLVRLGAQALYSDTLTRTGMEMQHLPLDPIYARMLVEARKYGKDVELQMAAMASACQQDGITMTEIDAEKWRRMTKETRSDMLVQLDILAQSINMNDAELSSNNIIQQRLVKAKRLLERLCEELGMDMMQLKIPNEAERQKLIGCIIAGADTLFTLRNNGMYSNGNGFEGRLAKSTSLQYGESIIVGTPLNLEHYRNKIKRSHNIILNATVVTAEQLEKHAPWRCSYDNKKFVVNKNGQVETASDSYFDGRAIHSTKYENAEPSQETTKALIEKLFKDSAPLEKMSPKTEAIYNEVARLRKLLIDRSDNQEYFDNILNILVENAASWKDVAVKDMYALSDILHKRQVYTWLQNTLSDESLEAQNILKDSPDIMYVDIDGQDLEVHIEYKNNKAFLDIPLHKAKYLEKVIDQFEGRQVYIWNDNSKKNFITLHNAIEKSIAGNRATRRSKKPVTKHDSKFNYSSMNPPL